MEDLVVEIEQDLTARRNANWYVGEFDTSRSLWNSWHRRLDEIDRVLSGEITYTGPNDRQVTERPRVPNRVQLALEDHASTAASVAPSFRCDAPSEKAKERSEKRERIAANYWTANKVKLLLSLWYQDYFAAGAAFHLVLPDYATGIPKIRRLDPAFCYLSKPYRPDEAPGSLIVAYRRTLESLLEDFPDQRGELSEARKEKQVDVYEYYDGSEYVRVAAWTANAQRRGVVLGAPVPNLLSRAPFVVSARPTRNGIFRGAYDQAVAPLVTENAIANLLIDHMRDWVSSPLVEHDIENPQDYGTGAVLHGTSDQAFMRRMPPASANPQLFAVADNLRGAAREAANHPEGRAGHVSQAIISAAGVNSLQASMSQFVASAQEIEAEAIAEVLSLCFECDEKYLSTKPGSDEPWRKTIAGAKSFAESYTSKDINGEYQIRVEYGGKAGQDPFSYEIRLTQQHGNGLLSDETTMENLSTIEDVQRERDRLIRERSLKGVLALIEQQTAMGNPQPAIRLAQIVSEKQDVMQHLDEIAALLVVGGPGGEQPGQPGTSGTEAFTEASSLSRGGTTNVPGVGSLPPLASVMTTPGGSSPRIVANA